MTKHIPLTIISTLLLAHMTLAQKSDLSIPEQVDSLLMDATAQGLFSGTLRISRWGEDIYSKSFGYADWEDKTPFDESTVFNIGSLNKQFTEEMVHQLAAEKKIAYTDRLSRFLKQFPKETAEKISLQQLLDMTSGMGDYLRHPDFMALEEKDFSMAELLELIKTEPLLFEPGSAQRYSNSGYVVLGAVIEEVTGKSYQENLEERILAPLGMKEVLYTKAEKAKVKNRAKGTRVDFEGQRTTSHLLSTSTPAGGLFTDIGNLMRFTEAKMKSSLPSGKEYGQGMFAGGTPFWNSIISYDHESGYVLVILANAGNVADQLAPRIRSILNNEPYPPLELPFERKLFDIINEKGYDHVKTNIKGYAEQLGLLFDSEFLNFYGYEFLYAGRPEIAIELFKMNVDLFPKVANTYDSLAEAYLKAGDRGKALKYYRLALEKNPNNEMARKTIAEMEAQD